MKAEYFFNAPQSFLEKRVEEGLECDSSTLTPPFPKNGLFELTNWCNHSCIFCTNPRMSRGHGTMDLDLFADIAEEAVGLGLEEIGLYTTGEPFFLKNLHEYVAAARDAGARYVYVTTNGALATPDRVVPVIEAGLSSIKFSIHGGTRETYQLIHGRDDWDQVVANVAFVSEYRRASAPHLKLMCTFTVTRFNDAEKTRYLDTFLPLVDEVAFYPVDNQAGQSLAVLSRLRPNAWPPKANSQVGPCSMLWNRLHVTWEGYLDLCCIDYENALTYADLRQTGLKDAWHNAVAREMRRRHQTQQLAGTLCRNCLYGTTEPVYPISLIGHQTHSLPLMSSAAKGGSAVDARIRLLEQRP